MKSRRNDSVFLNIPYDNDFESLFVAYVAGLTAHGLVPRATIELPSSERRLDRIIALIRTCRYSIHDLSRVEIDARPPPTPRFNMPFELGLAVAIAASAQSRHDWFVFESKPHRLAKSLSDLNGTDPQIHGGEVDGVLRTVSNVLSRRRSRPTIQAVIEVYVGLTIYARRLAASHRGSLFEARVFVDFVAAASKLALELAGKARTK